MNENEMDAIVAKFSAQLQNIVKQAVDAARREERAALVSRLSAELKTSLKVTHGVSEARQRTSSEEVKKQMEKILEIARTFDKLEFQRSDIVKNFPDVEPEQIGRALRKLVKSKHLKMRGNRRNAFYSLTTKSKK